MGVFLRVFDPKGFQNPYTGSDWRKVERQKVEPIEPVRPHRVQNELPPVTTGALPREAPKDNEEEEPSSNEEAENLEQAKQPSRLEKDITKKQEFFGPGEITCIAADLIKSDYPTISRSQSVLEASKLLKESKIHQLPVVTEEGHICGLITENQIFRKLIEEKEKRETLDKKEVKTVMVSPVLCCLMGTPLSVLINTLLEENVSVIPVVDSQDTLKGVVTKNSILAFIFNSSHFFDHDPSKSD